MYLSITLFSGVSTLFAVLFDLEGTLVQSVEGDHDAILEFRSRTREKLLELGIPSSELRNLTRSTLIRNKAREYVEEHFSKKRAKQFHVKIDKFLKSYELRWADQSRIFPDTLSALQKLESLGYKMGIVTNTSKEAANRILDIHGMQDFFEVVVTREDVKMLKPHPEGILIALRRLEVKDFFFIGDLVHDSQAAKEADGISIIVNRNQFKKLKFNPHHVVRSLLEISHLARTQKTHDLNESI